MHRILVVVFTVSFFLAGAGVGPALAGDKATGGKATKDGAAVTAYSDRELALEYENLGLKIGQWADAIKAAQAKRAEIEAEAKRRAAAKPAPVKGTSATKDGKP